jgi:hypothetical protein
MGTIPFPNIAQEAGEVAATPQNAFAEYARVAQLKEQTATLQQQQQERAQQMEVQRRSMADQDATTKSFLDWDHKDPNELAVAVVKNGGSATAAQAIQQHYLGLRKTASDIAKQDADTGSTTLKTKIDQYNQDAGRLSALDSVPDEQFNQHLTDEGQKLAASQDPQEQQSGQHILQLAQLPVPQARQQLKVIEHALLGEKEQHEQAFKDAEVAKDRAAAAKDEAETGWQKFPELGVMYNTQSGETKSVTGNGAVMTPGMMEAKYVQLAAKQASKQPLSKEDAAWKAGYEKYKTLVPVANFNLQNNGAAADNNGNPSAIAQAIAENRMKWSEAVSPRTPQATKNAIMAQVFKLNPQYDTSEFGLETDAAKKARSGAWADTRLAYNTAIDHSKQLLDAIDALNSGDVKKLNSMKNFFKTEFGSPDVPTFSAIANAYNHEVTSVVSKGHITDAEVATGHATLPDNASPQALRGVVNAYTGLMTSKRDELDKIIKAGAGNKANSVMNVKAGGENDGSRKVLSLAQIRKAAKDHNVSTDEAIRQAKTAGYTVQ